MKWSGLWGKESIHYTYFLCSDLGGDALPAYIFDLSALYIIIYNSGVRGSRSGSRTPCIATCT